MTWLLSLRFGVASFASAAFVACVPLDGKQALCAAACNLVGRAK